MGMLISIVAGRQLHRSAVAQDSERFELESLYVAANLESTMERYEERLARLADHCAISNELPAAIWNFRRESMTDLNGNLPCVMSALYCPRIPADEFTNHLERGLATWKNGYHFDASPGSSGQRRLALPVWHRWMREGYDAIPRGTDMAIATNWHPSLDVALGAGSAWISPGRHQIRRQNGEIETGVWFVIPIFPLDQGADTQPKALGNTAGDLTNRRWTFRRTVSTGLIAVYLSTDRMIDRAYNSTNRPVRIHARLYANREALPEALLNPGSVPPNTPRHYREIIMPWYGRRWRLEFRSTPFFEAESTRYRAWFAAGGGTAFSLLAGALIAVGLRSRFRQEHLTAEITDARDAITAAERERERLGHDLHDGAIQSLYAVQLNLRRTIENISDSAPDSARVLHDTLNHVNEVIVELRNFILTNETPVPGRTILRLDQVLASVVQRQQTAGAPSMHLNALPSASKRLTAPQAVALAQIARTALSNAIRHSGARNIRVTLRDDLSSVTLGIDDDGIGFDASHAGVAGVGLRTIRERAAELGARLTIDSRPGVGTCITVALQCRPVPES